MDTPRTPNGIEAKNYLHRLFHKTIGKNGIGKKEQEMEFIKLNKQEQTTESGKGLFSISLLMK